MASVHEVSDNTFKSEVLDSEIPVMVDFWAPWCGPCVSIAPVIEELSSELQGKVKVVKMNVDENPNTPGQLGIRSIPTIKVFVKGEEAKQSVGAVSKDQLKELVSSYV